jgi:flavin reductase (DIM6/NTAB) family NADH-FMN oxidoreductase RutF/DNA-binding IclR family transcriptional regulator
VPEASSARAADAQHFRHVLGHFPTGVVVITAMGDNGKPAGMAVGSFTSVSLNPPLVAFLPDKSSSSWPKIETTGRFCVNVLTSAQEHVCRAMASKAEDKFAGIDWRPAGSGAPIIDGVAAWIDCDIDTVHEAGDHYIVIGRVRDLDIADPVLPLIFYQGGYGRFSPRTLAANDADLVDQLAVVDVARTHMDSLARDLEVECLASAVVDDEVVLIASSGAPRTGRRPTRVGSRMPFLPPIGYIFAAWADEAIVNAWMKRLALVGHAHDEGLHREKLARVRARGFSLGLGGDAHHEFEIAIARLAREGNAHPDEEMHRVVAELADDYEPEDITSARTYPVKTVTAPVFGADGTVVLALALFGLPDEMTADELASAVGRLTAATDAVTRAVGGTPPV